MESSARISDITNVSGAQVQVVVRKLKISQHILGISFGNLSLLDLSLNETSPFPSTGMQQGKHMSQHSSLIAHMRRLGLFSDEKRVCFVELGSGVGRLSDQLQEETSCRHLHLLIDRDKFKATRLRERTMQKRASSTAQVHPLSSISVHRVTNDIKNVALSEALTINFGLTDISMVALSKHLCGKGFDMALCKVIEYNEKQHSECPEVPLFAPICMAPCCHAICEWEECFYKPYYINLGFTPEDYAVIAASSQWASIQLDPDDLQPALSTTCNELVLTQCILEKMQETSTSDIPDGSSGLWPPIMGESTSKENYLLSLPSKELESLLDKKVKQRFGVICKEFIDIGRAVGLLAAGYSEVRLLRYTFSSKENMLICAK